MTALTYGLSTLMALWALGGGDSALFWQRQWILGLVLLILGVSALVLQKRTAALKGNSASFMLGTGAAIASAIPVIALIWIGRHVDAVPALKVAATSLRPSSPAEVLLTALILAPGFELVSRGVLMPAWGIGGVAFLDAFTVGFGLQTFVPFLVIWGMGYVWGFIARQFGLMTAVVSHSLWALFVFGALFYL